MLLNSALSRLVSTITSLQGIICWYILFHVIFILSCQWLYFQINVYWKRRSLKKKQGNCNFMLKYNVKISFRQFSKILCQFFYLFRTSKNLKICMAVWFAQLYESKQFLCTFIGLYFNKWTNGHHLKNVKKQVRWKLLYIAIYFSMTVTRNETATQKILFWIPAHIQFSLYLKKPVLLSKITRRFDIVYMVN